MIPSNFNIDNSILLFESSTKNGIGKRVDEMCYLCKDDNNFYLMDEFFSRGKVTSRTVHQMTKEEAKDYARRSFDCETFNNVIKYLR